MSKFDKFKVIFYITYHLLEITKWIIKITNLVLVLIGVHYLGLYLQLNNIVIFLLMLVSIIITIILSESIAIILDIILFQIFKYFCKKWGTPYMNIKLFRKYYDKTYGKRL